jgi:hypothetical protein
MRIAVRKATAVVNSAKGEWIKSLTGVWCGDAGLQYSYLKVTLNYPGESCFKTQSAKQNKTKQICLSLVLRLRHLPITHPLAPCTFPAPPPHTHIIIVFVCSVCVYVFPGCKYGEDNNLQELVLSFYHVERGR